MRCLQCEPVSQRYLELTSPRARTHWILERRGPKRRHDPLRPYAAFVEEEIGPDGSLWPTATLFLTNRECPFRCLMCDLWQDTLDTRTEVGAIVAQIDHALAQPAFRDARAVKLYNAGSFFDPAAIPPSDIPAIAQRVRGYERVIVECHTAFVGPRVIDFAAAIAPAKLEVAIGLETVHPEVLKRLNKRMTVDDFRRAAALLQEHGIALRVFLLVRPPFLTEDEGIFWACRSLDVAFDAGASLAALIPVRAGNGALDELARTGDFTPPRLESLETCLRYGLALGKGRVTADLWDAAGDDACIARIAAMNLTQRPPER